MRRHAKAPSAGSTRRQATGLGRIFRGALATRGASSEAGGSGAPSATRLALALCAALALVSALAVPAQAATRAKLTELGAPFGTGSAGALFVVSGVGVNQTGTGGVDTGEVYVAERGGNRVSEFSAAGEFVRAWGYDVVSSGQDNTGANEQQRVQVKATKGVFSLTVRTAIGVGTRTSGSTTVTGVSNNFGTFQVGDAIEGTGIPAGTTITAVGSGTLTLSQAATEALTSELISTENTGATGRGDLTAGSNEVTGLKTNTGNFAVGKTITGTGIPIGTTITGLGSGTLTLSAPVEAGKSGTAVALTATNIPFNASAAELKSALEALPGVGSGDVAVSGGPGDATGSTPYAVTFSGGLFAGNDVNQMGSSAAGLSEGTKTVTIGTSVPGGGAEVCNAVSSPADVCKKATSSTVAGGLGLPSGLAVDQSTGNVYVYGNPSRRVAVFSAEGIFEGAFGWNVISSGALGTGTLTAGSTSVTSVATASRAFLVGQTISGTGIPADTTITAVGGSTNTITLSQPPVSSGAGVELTAATATGNVAQNEKQTVTIGGAPSGGTFTLTFRAPKPSEAAATATAIPFNASAAEVQAKLEGLAGIGAGSVEVTSPNPTGGPYTIEFKGTRYADTNVSQMTAAGAGLTPSGTVAIATVRDGGALELCTTSSECLAGESTDSAGGFAESPATPRNLSVDSSGKIYVPDPANLRFDVFSPVLNGADEVTGATFVRAIGWRVVAGTAENKLQECTTLTGCQQGSAGNEDGQFGEGLTAAIADSSGNVYTLNSSGSCATTTCRIQKFNPDGTVADTSFGPDTGECSTVRTSGSVSGGSGSGVGAIAVDPSTGNVLAFTRSTPTTERICELDSSGSELGAFPSPSLPSADEPAGLVSGTGERVYASYGSSLTIFGPAPAPGVQILPVTESGQTSAKLNGKVTVPTLGGEGFDTVYHFELSADGGSHWTNVPASDVSVGSTAGTFEVHQSATGLQPNINYLARLVAITGPSAVSEAVPFTTGAAPPSVEGLVAVEITASGAKLRGTVNPNNSATTYRFEWGTTTAYGNQSPDFDPFVGSGGQAQFVTAKLSGLSASTVHHFRLVATNPAGTTKGPDQQLTTAEARQQLNASGLPDNRGAELVSPANKRPSGVVGDIGLASGSQLLTQAAEDGSSLIYPLMNGIDTSTAGGFLRERAGRTSAGWLSSQLSASSLVSAVETIFNIVNPSKLVYSSPDLSCGVIETFNPLTPDTPQTEVEQGVFNLYRWDEDGGYQLITNRVPLNPSFRANDTAGYYKQVGASPDCSRVYFHSNYVFLPGASGLYEWDEGTPRDAGVLPNGAPSAGGVVGGETEIERTSRWNAVSRDGSRFFFSATSNEGKDAGKRAVFMREDGGASVIDVSQSHTAVLPNGALYETASPDGTHVFFRANYGIAPTTSAGPTNGNCAQVDGNSIARIEKVPCDLYDYDVKTGELTDLSADSNPADSVGAAVQGVVAVSEDGSRVYFAALGQLVPGKGKTYAENIAGFGSANLYLAEDGELTYVTTLAQRNEKAGELLGGRGGSAGGVSAGGALMRLSGPVASTTSDGGKLLFVSSGNLTGYESGGIQEAYLYSAGSEELVCVSCRPDGLPSVYTPGDKFPSTPEAPNAPLSDLGNPIAGFGASPVAAYRPRSMSEDGSRVFFTSWDVLAPGGVAEKENVYEWENGQVYFLAVARPSGGNGFGRFLDSSASGDDVFIATSEKLAPQDNDFVSDAYDIRVGGGFAPEPTPIPCVPAKDECQGAPSPPPPASSPASSGFSGPGNQPDKATKKHKKHKKHRNSKHRKSKAQKHQAKKRHRTRTTNSNRGGVK